jgi:hypothetical protein
MTPKEIANLPHGTPLYCISRKRSRTGMREFFDVFYVVPIDHVSRYALRWIRITKDHAEQWRNKSNGVIASTSSEMDARIDASFYVNGCGFDKAGELVRSIERFAGVPENHFIKERV